jgi:hypothetical protein
MPAWSSSLLELLDERLGNDTSSKRNSRADKNRDTRARNVHLAIFVEKFLRFLLAGQKTVESRFSIHRHPPFGRVRQGDIVLIKESGGPVVAIAEVSEVWYYEMDADARDVIRARFGKQLCVEPEFWESKAASCYATLMQFSRVEPLPPIPCSKRDRRGWVVLRSCGEQSELFAEQGLGS